MTRLSNLLLSLCNFVRRNGLAFSLGLIAIYLTMGIIGLMHHEMWRDEVFPWLLAKDANSLPELFRNLRYDGPHFAAWHLILWVVSRFTHRLVAEQITHLILAVLAVGLFVRFSPFNWRQKLLFCFGYFPLFEYCLICRMYVLIWLLMFLFCTAFGSRQRTYLPLSVILFVLANTTVVGTIMAVALAGGLVAEFVLSGQQRANYQQRRWNVGIGLSLFFVGVFAALVQLALKAEHLPAQAMSGWWTDFRHTPSRLADALQNVWNVFVPLPNGFPYWPNFAWGTNMFTGWYDKDGWVFVILSVILVVIASATLIRSPGSLFVWAFGLVLLLGFQTATGPGALRHSGFLFILYIVCLWLEHDPHWLKRSSPGLEKFTDRLRNSFLAWVLLVHVAAGVYAWSFDYAHPFSEGKVAAAFIKANNLQNLLLMGSPGNDIMPIAAYLDQNIYCLDNGRFEGFHIATDTNTITADQLARDVGLLERFK